MSGRATRRAARLLPGLVALLCWSASARGQWRLDPDVAALTPSDRQALLEAVRAAPSRALEAILREETEHLERLRRDELSALQREAWRRLFEERRQGSPLGLALSRTLDGLGLRSRELLARVWEEERARLAALPLRAVEELVDQAFRRALVQRLAALRDARLSWRRDWRPGPLQAGARFAWRSVAGDAALGSLLALPPLTAFHDEVALRAALVGRELSGPWGRLRVEAAAVEGLARARGGSTALTTAAGQRVEGVGVEFAARARVTGLDLEGAGELRLGEADLGLTLRVEGQARAQAEAAAELTALASERGAAANLGLRAGAGATATLRVPLTLELVLLRARVVPQASLSSGAQAEAKLALELEWCGRMRLEAAASASFGLGGGAGVTIEVELGEPIKRALGRALADPRGLLAELGERLRGRTWQGPRGPSGALVLGLDELAALAAGRTEPSPERPERLAARFAPLLHQRITHAAADALRAVDFDGNWDPSDDWAHLARPAPAVVYWSVAATETHWFLTYAWYHPRREGQGPFAGHPNDLRGCLVAARRGASPGREVEGVILIDGDAMAPLAGELTGPGRFTTLAGEVRFVDEADHPWLDVERTHPQLWITGGDHRVLGFNGNDDADPFSGLEGRVYLPPGSGPTAQGPGAETYELRPLEELLAHAEDPAWVDGSSRALLAGSSRELPTRLRGGRGDARAIPPWAWFETVTTWHSSPSAPGAHEILAGHTWSDPARTVALLLEVGSTPYARSYLSGQGLIDRLPR